MSDLTSLVEQLLQTQEAMEPLKAREADLKARIRDATGEPGTYDADGHTVTLTPNRRLDVAALAKAYPAAERPELYDLAPSTKKARAHLSPAELDAFMAESGEPRLVIR